MTLQGFKVELRPTHAQRARLAQHTGLHRVVFNHCLAHVKATMDQRAAERTYGIGDADRVGVNSRILRRSITKGLSMPGFRDELAELVVAVAGTTTADPSIQLELDDEF